MSLIKLALVALFAAICVAGGGTEDFEQVRLAGKVVPLHAALQARGLKVDPEPVAAEVVLIQDDGTLIALFSDEGSRALFQDKRLQNRRAVLMTRRHRGIPWHQVVTFQVEDGGKLRTPEYYCEICTISVRYPQTCPCCQGPMELRMKPEAN